MIPVSVENVSISNVGFVVLLKSSQDERTLPIFIGVPEAQAIAIHLNEVTPPRPMTHDLLKNVLDMLEGRLDHVEVHDLKDGTFFGRLILFFEGRSLEVDSRPSDAIALALRCHAPILVADTVMKQAGILLDGEQAESEQTLEDSDPPEPKDPVERLKADLARAVRDERYEEAARLRDELKRVTSAN